MLNAMSHSEHLVNLRNRAKAAPGRAEGRIIFTADAVARPVKSSRHTSAFASRTAGSFPRTAGCSVRSVESSSRTDGSFTGLVGRVARKAGASNRTVGRANRMAEPFCRTAEASNHTVRPFCPTAESASRTGGPFCPTADVSDRTAGRANRTRKSFYRAAEPFYRTEKSSNRTVFRQKHAKTGKNHPFPPSRPARWSKNDSLRRSAGRARHSVRAAYARTLASDGSFTTLAAGRGLPALSGQSERQQNPKTI
jgi:hypothetical protein